MHQVVENLVSAAKTGGENEADLMIQEIHQTVVEDTSNFESSTHTQKFSTSTNSEPADEIFSKVENNEEIDVNEYDLTSVKGKSGVLDVIKHVVSQEFETVDEDEFTKFIKHNFGYSAYRAGEKAEDVVEGLSLNSNQSSDPSSNSESQHTQNEISTNEMWELSDDVVNGAEKLKIQVDKRYMSEEKYAKILYNLTNKLCIRFEDAMDKTKDNSMCRTALRGVVAEVDDYDGGFEFSAGDSLVEMVEKRIRKVDELTVEELRSG
jgi:hypothetical protein